MVKAKPELLERIRVWFDAVEKAPNAIKTVLRKIAVDRVYDRPGLYGQHCLRAVESIPAKTILGSYGGRLMTDEAFMNSFASRLASDDLIFLQMVADGGASKDC